ncbi:MAG: response regulator [Deltaproteobacteria bacterium]|nr:response regulator [Deltaproteobacteria bacterium]
MTRRIETALLVDDDDAFRTTLQSALRRRGVTARTAATVEEGLFALEDSAVDMVTVDYRMPRENGLAAIPRFRRVRADAVIIMLTGFGDIPLAVEAVKEGADTLLTKPVDADHLLKVATELLHKQRPSSGGGPATPLSYNLDELERDTIKAALKQSDGVVARAARLLGIDRRTLQRKLKKIF